MSKKMNMVVKPMDLTTSNGKLGLVVATCGELGYWKDYWGLVSDDTYTGASSMIMLSLMDCLAGNKEGLICETASGEYVGSLTWSTDNGVAHVRMLAVDDPYRNQGAGHKLMKSFLRKHKKAQLICSLNLISYYARFGFRAVGSTSGHGWFTCINTTIQEGDAIKNPIFYSKEVMKSLIEAPNIPPEELRGYMSCAVDNASEIREMAKGVGAMTRGEREALTAALKPA